MNRVVVYVSAAMIAATSPVLAAPPSADSPERAADDGDKVICKRFIKTGTLAGRYRTCKTKAEWERERDNIRQLNVSDSCRDRGNGGAGCAG